MSALPDRRVRVVVFAGPTILPDEGDARDARPWFPGHRPPRPPDACEAPDAIAHEHGIDAFCHDIGNAEAWETLRTRLTSAMAFCLRLIDGDGSDERLAQACASAFADPRYLTIGRRPLVVVSRARGAGALIAGLRSAGSPFIVAPAGGDAIVEEVPFLDRLRPMNPHVTGLDKAFEGTIASYRAQVLRSNRDAVEGKARYRAAFPGWDETPRRGRRATILTGSSPELFGYWIEALVVDARRRFQGDEALVFVHAWNDWPNGCALAPEPRERAAFLEALRDGVASGSRARLPRYDRPSARAIADDLARAIASGELAVARFGEPPAPESPGVSVVMPVYNHARFLDRALASVAAQTLAPLELVAVDDGSSDDGAAIVERFARTAPFPVTLARQPNRGAHVALNRGLALARGTAVALINSDDAYHPERLARMTSRLQQGTALVFSDVELVDAEDEPASNEVAQALRARLDAVTAGHSTVLEALVSYNVAVSTGNFVFARALVDATGGFSELRLCHDWDFVLAATRYGEVVRVASPLYRYRLHGANTGTSGTLHTFREIDRVLARFLHTIGDHPRVDDAARARLREQVEARGRGGAWPG